MAIQIQFRRGTAAEWTAANPILALAEMGVETDTEKFKLGDGSTAWNALSYGGIKGDKGDKGDQGEKGDKGDKGDTGDQGEQGIPGTPGAATFLELTDAPSSYSGQGGKAVAVKSDATGLEFIPAATPFDPENPGPIGATTPSTGAFTRLSVAQGTLTDPVTGLSLSATWNDAADTFRGLEIVITDTASAAASTLLRILGGAAGTTELFRITKSGNVTMSAGILSAPQMQATTSMLVSNDTTGYYIGLLSDVQLRRGGAAILQMGANHATTAIAQRIQAHGVGIGTGASLTLGGGSGTTKGNVILDGGNRSVYIASPSATEIRDILISHGLMAAS